MKCNTRRAREESVINAYQVIGKSILAYLDASAGCVVSDLCGFKKKRLQAMYDTTNESVNYLMEHYGEGCEDTRERADAALWSAKRRLKDYANFDFDEATEAYQAKDTFFSTWHSQSDISKHRTRMQFIEDMDLVARTYHVTILFWFWQTYGYARDRLTRLYKLLRDDYNLWITEYLRCNAAGDKKTQEMLLQRQDRMQELGLEFEEV